MSCCQSKFYMYKKKKNNTLDFIFTLFSSRYSLCEDHPHRGWERSLVVITNLTNFFWGCFDQVRLTCILYLNVNIMQSACKCQAASGLTSYICGFCFKLKMYLLIKNVLFRIVCIREINMTFYTTLKTIFNSMFD